MIAVARPAGRVDHTRDLCGPSGENMTARTSEGVWALKSLACPSEAPPLHPRSTWVARLDEPHDPWYYQDEMAHQIQQVLTTLAVAALLGFSLTGCTATWSGEISVQVHYPTIANPPAEDSTP